MRRVAFEKLMKRIEGSWFQCNNIETNLEKLLDTAATNLSEDEYYEFKIMLREIIQEYL